MHAIGRRLAAATLVVAASPFLLTGEHSSAATEIDVAVKPVEPFVYIDDSGVPTGYSIDLWNLVAEELDLTTRFVVYDNVGDVVDAVASGEVDAGIAAISVTAEREELVDFTHAYFDSGLRIMIPTKSDESPALTALRSVANVRLLGPLLVFALLVVAIGHLIWATERRADGDFPQAYSRGIRESIWWSLVNITTGGDAEKKIQRPLGRIVAGAWMVLGLFVVALVTAQVTTALTVRELRSDVNGIDDLYERDVVTVRATLADDELDRLRVQHRTVGSIAEVFEAVESGDADAAVYDAPVLEFYANTAGAGVVEVVGPMLNTDRYAIALGTDSPLRERVNEVLLVHARDGTFDRLYRAWFER